MDMLSIINQRRIIKKERGRKTWLGKKKKKSVKLVEDRLNHLWIIVTSVSMRIKETTTLRSSLRFMEEQNKNGKKTKTIKDGRKDGTKTRWILLS